MCVWTMVQNCVRRESHCRFRSAIALVLPACAAVLLSGCQIFEQPVAGATQPALNWLAHFGVQDSQTAAPFDLSLIRPAEQAAPVQTGDLLEVTVSNLFQPEEPHTFPTRVQADGRIEVPLLGYVEVVGQTRSEIENQLIQKFEQGDLLINPAIIVRDLEVPQVKVSVEGAVERPGMIPLAREDASVYAALVSAGGLKNNAGSHISIARRLTPAILETAALFSVDPDLQQSSEDASSQTAGFPTRVARTNSKKQGKKDAQPSQTEHDAARPPRMADVLSPDQMRQNSKQTEYEVIWFDVHRDDDRRALIEIRLSDGDIVNVSEVMPPIQVTGAVQNPGTYHIPNSDSVTVIDALNLAGGIVSTETPLTVTLIRPGESGWPGRRWSSKLDRLQANPSHAPVLHPRDIIHVERPAGSTLKQAVGGWLGK